MTQQKYWWFKQVDGKVYIYCSNSASVAGGKRLASNRYGKEYGAVKKISLYNRKTSPSAHQHDEEIASKPGPSARQDQDQTSQASQSQDVDARVAHEQNEIKVFFFTEKPRVLDIGQFVWNANEFSRLFKPKAGSLLPSLDFVDAFEAAVDPLEDCDISGVTDADTSSEETDNTDRQNESTKARKRQTTTEADVTPLYKKRHHTAEPELSEVQTLKNEVEHALLGHVKISLDNLSIGMQIRPVRDDFVQHLQGEMATFSNSAYQPLVVLTKTLSTKDAFSEANANGYKYEVIGGQHNLLATEAMRKKNPGNDLFQSRWCTVYFGGMSSDAKKYLANKHNVMGDCRHQMTFKEKVQLCNNIRKEYANLSDSAWSRKCCAILHEEPKSMYMRAVLFLAGRTDETFELIEQVLTMHEKGELKGQTLRKKEIKSGVPQVRVYIFRSYQSLPEKAFIKKLKDVMMLKITLAEFQKDGEELVKLQKIQRSIMDVMNAASWEDIESRFPHHSSREVLYQFINLKYSKSGIPLPIRKFCDFLAKVEKADRDDDLFQDVVHRGKNNSVGYHIQAKCQQVTLRHILDLDATFPGFHLGILDMPKEWDEKHLENFLANYTSINITAKLTGYSVVVLCQVLQLPWICHSVRETQQFEYVAGCYYHITNRKSDDPLTESVWGMVIAMHEKPSKVKWALNPSSSSNLIACAADKSYRGDDGEIVDQLQKPLDLYRELVLTFSAPHQWIMDACCRTGTGLIAALKEGRSCVSIEEDQGLLSHLPSRLHDSMPCDIPPKSKEGQVDIYDYVDEDEDREESEDTEESDE